MIALTGGSGFVGGALLNALCNTHVRCFGREKPKLVSDASYYNGEITSHVDFSAFVRGVDCIIHCAARVHMMSDPSIDPLEAFREVNTYGTLNLAQQAADAGVRRFIFISSIKVNGESTIVGTPFKPSDNCIPTDDYGLSKYEAEEGLRKIAQETGMELVIIRPPLVYGAGVKANFASIMKYISKGIPLPLGGIKENRRSFVSVNNLVDLILICVDHPKAANQVFLASDDDDISTTQLLENMAIALNAPNRLIPIPCSWLTFFVRFIGKPGVSMRLCGSLQVDISKNKELLNWSPPYSSEKCMKETANSFLSG